MRASNRNSEKLELRGIVSAIGNIYKSVEKSEIESVEIFNSEYKTSQDWHDIYSPNSVWNMNLFDDPQWEYVDFRYQDVENSYIINYPKG